MKNSKPRRAALFSLSARIRRRSAKTFDVVIAPDGAHDIDDDCPLCVAARSGLPLPLDLLDDPTVLEKEARRVLARVDLAPGEELEIMHSGRMLPDQSYELSSYTVAADGAIYLTRNGQRTLVTRIEIAR